MANFILDNTASDINTALGKVLSPDTSPTQTDALVTSGGVKTYVDNAVDGLNTRVTTAESDISALQTGTVRVARYSRAANTYYSGTSIVQLTEDSDPDNIGTVLTSGDYDGGVQVGAGTYLITCIGEFYEEDDDNADYFLVNLRSSGTTLLSHRINETEGKSTGDYESVNQVYVLTVPAGSTSDINIQFQRVSNTSGSSRNVYLTLVRL